MSKYVVYDLEMCKVPKGEKREEFGSRQELIQIGAVLLDEEFKTIDTFMTYVAPRFGFVDSFIEKLTGITPAKISGIIITVLLAVVSCIGIYKTRRR